ncbi:MAG: hypothetical protein GY725_06620, partial [bacterium]|nr:hypothetical protein [bacterium]
MSDARDRQELIDRHLRGELSESERERLAELLDSDAAARKDFVEQVQWDTRLAEVLREGRGSRREPNVDEGADAIFAERTPTITLTRALLAISAAIIIMLTASLCFQWLNPEQPIARPPVEPPGAERPIAKITGLSSPLQWTGDGGRVSYDLSVGLELAGGTVEGLAPGSWVELEFNDGSTATISGNSMLTFSDHGQKMLHLKQGNLSSNAKPQPPGKPMLVYTRSAVLEVLGTQFEVEAETATTILNVSEG